MNTNSAIALIGQITFKPGWRFTATSLDDRFENCVRLRIEYPARLTNRGQAPQGYPIEVEPSAEFALLVGQCDELSLLRQVFDCIMKVECHENREFYRIAPTWWAPFHPHRHDGMERWGDPHGDLTFGVA